MSDIETTSVLSVLFSDNRAEWPSEHFKELFVEPTYLSKLESVRPCFLVGGRGTGKTTSLQSLKYDSTYERLISRGLDFGDQEYLGVLVRMNKNRVRAFQGGGIDDEHWNKVFAHYFNLLVCFELTELGLWLETKTGRELRGDYIDRISSDFGISSVSTLSDLKNEIRKLISELQIYVNNPNSSSNIILSIAESPVRTFSEVLMESGFAGDRVFFCCVDEYENLLDYQQAVLNTYIKHAEPPLSYKVGVRKNGFRNRQTLDGQDLLSIPDDYAEIEIADEGFEYFAKAVAELRLECAKNKGINVPTKLNEFLVDLSFSEEAESLGAGRISTQVLEELSGNEDLHLRLVDKSDSEIYFLKYWQEKTGDQLIDLAQHWINNERVWETRRGNHGYASLFWLGKGRKGARVRKYYCGERVFLSLPAGNIRYFLELIDAAINHELEINTGYDQLSSLGISPMAQTLAVRDVGKRRLNQLEGLADHGVQLKRLVLAIGKVFFEMAREPAQRSPEVNSFVIDGDKEDVEKIRALLIEGVGHLAFEVTPRTKATSNLEMKDDEYRLHRIFSGFFEISHRKKRSTKFDATHLLGVLDSKPSKAIQQLLEGGEQVGESDLPEQLALFSSFYSGDGN